MTLNASETYARLLLPHGHGYPLWIPEPNEALPEDYRATGVRIGDVGLVTADGAFDFLFNVFLPAEDPLNQWHGVPEGFVALPWNPRLLQLNSQRHRPGVPISSLGSRMYMFEAEASAQIPGVPVAVGGGIELKFTQSRGAVLMLPSGASRVDYRNLAIFRDYAAVNADSWYQFVNGPSLGREAQNGSLYLITGYDKTCAWETAAFSNPTHEQTVSIKFASAPLGEGKLSMTRSSMMQSFLSSRCSNGGNVNNQAMFIRGFKITMRQGAGARLLGSAKVSSIVGRPPKDVMYRGGIVHRPGNDASHGFAGGRSGSGDAEGARRCEGAMDADLCSTSSRSDSSFVSSASSLSLNPQMYHPSNVINAYMLDLCANADVAITHDSEWCSIIHEFDRELPDDIELLKRIKARYDVALAGANCVSLALQSTRIDGPLGSWQSVDSPARQGSWIVIPIDEHDNGNHQIENTKGFNPKGSSFEDRYQYQAKRPSLPNEHGREKKPVSENDIAHTEERAEATSSQATDSLSEHPKSSSSNSFPKTVAPPQRSHKPSLLSQLMNPDSINVSELRPHHKPYPPVDPVKNVSTRSASHPKVHWTTGSAGSDSSATSGWATSSSGSMSPAKGRIAPPLTNSVTVSSSPEMVLDPTTAGKGKLQDLRLTRRGTLSETTRCSDLAPEEELYEGSPPAYEGLKPPSQSSKSLSSYGYGYGEGTMSGSAPINIPAFPYNLPPAPPPTSPRTTRQQMLRTEMPESLRTNLLWSRRLHKQDLDGSKKDESFRVKASGGSGTSVEKTESPTQNRKLGGMAHQKWML